MLVELVQEHVAEDAALGDDGDVAGTIASAMVSAVVSMALVLVTPTQFGPRTRTPWRLAAFLGAPLVAFPPPPSGEAAPLSRWSFFSPPGPAPPRRRAPPPPGRPPRPGRRGGGRARTRQTAGARRGPPPLGFIRCSLSPQPFRCMLRGDGIPEAEAAAPRSVLSSLV